MTFVRGYTLESGKVLLEGEDITITTVQGVVVEGMLVKASKKKTELQVEGEVETRTYLNEVIVSMEKL